MDVPFATASTSTELHALLNERFAEEDVVLIDTSGRSPRDPAGIAEIRRLLEDCPGLEIHLVLAANGRARDLAFALERFSVLPIRNLLFTKLDETTRRGGVFTLSLKARRPVSYLGTGQEVPEDLCEASPATLLDGLFATEVARVQG
jgi:flagellar biosynthesis protein FlhF